MPLREGEIVGPYQVVNQLGQGGMASVYKAYHAKLDRHVAIKVLHQAFKEDPDFIARFEREAQIVAKLEHPHIVPVYDYSEHEGQPYLVMKFVEGRTLKRVLSDGPLPLESITSIMGSVAGALTYAHQKGVLHRDIKPSNIMIDTNGVPYLTDFGLARIAQAGASTMSADMILGTPQYISPEQAAGTGTLDARTDIYSLGVILYEMVVGRVPYNADTPYAIVHKHIYDELPRPSSINPEIPPAVEDVLVRALAKQPEGRFVSAVQMMDTFRRAVQQSGLVELDPQRDQQAEERFVQRGYEGPTITERTPQDVIPSPFAPPRPPSPPSPPTAPSGSRPKVKVVKDKKAYAEFQLDLSLEDAGRKMEEGLKRGAGWVSRVASEVEAAAKSAAKEAGRAIAESRRDEILTEEERIRKRIEKRYQERQGFIIHLFVFIVINLLFWAIWSSASGYLPVWIGEVPPEVPREFVDGTFPWPIFITLPWLIGLISHYIGYYNKFGPGAMRREALIQREIARERERSLVYEKPKNEARRRLELRDDGEIVEVEDEISRAEKQKRGNW
ncbi:MAG: protein kinase [Anaerolineae bacterium]|nr:protein kinase [Anaerolineae bacterium]